jgi:4'-phosphopantetheinyl transferase
MPLCKTIHLDQLTLLQWYMSESPAQLLRMLPSDLQPKMEQRISEISNVHRQQEILAAQVIVCRYLSSDTRIEHLADGSPFLRFAQAAPSTQPVAPLPHLSVSHSGPYLCIALHPDCSIGIDVQVRTDRIDSIAPRFLQPEEEPAGLSAAQLTQYRLICWSAKEAAFKVVGDPDAMLLSHFVIKPFLPTSPEGLLQCTYQSDSHAPMPLDIHYHLEPEYVLTYCLAAPDR